MRRTAALRIVSSLLLTAAVVAVGACATSEPVDGDLTDFGQGGSTTIPTEDAGSSTLPPSNPSSPGPVDEGPKDAGPKDTGAPPPADSGSSTGANDCDPNDPLTLIKFLAVVETATPCPCTSAECCYVTANVCLPK